jgi:hypothetical protein
MIWHVDPTRLELPKWSLAGATVEDYGLSDWRDSRSSFVPTSCTLKRSARVLSRTTYGVSHADSCVRSAHQRVIDAARDARSSMLAQGGLWLEQEREVGSRSRSIAATARAAAS